MSLVPALAEAHAARLARMARMGMPGGPVIRTDLIRPPAAAPRTTNVVPVPLAGRVRTWTPWHPAELAQLNEMAKSDLSARAIAKKLCRSEGGVKRKAQELGIGLRRATPAPTPSRIEGEDIVRLYKLVVDQDRSSIVRVRGIIRVCAEAHGLAVDDIMADGRQTACVRARQQAMWMAARETRLSMESIGKVFGRDHSTVIHAIRRENERTGQNVRGCGLPR